MKKGEYDSESDEENPENENKLDAADMFMWLKEERYQHYLGRLNSDFDKQNEGLPIEHKFKQRHSLERFINGDKCMQPMQMKVLLAKHDVDHDMHEREMAAENERRKHATPKRSSSKIKGRSGSKRRTDKRMGSKSKQGVPQEYGSIVSSPKGSKMTMVSSPAQSKQRV